MSRVIKFRAWTGKRMLTIDPLERKGTLSDLVEDESWKVMQFTGLTDRNGVEIYESDVVRFHYFYGTVGDGLGFVEADHELTGVVKWGVFGWGLEAIRGDHWCGYTGYSDGEGASSLMDLCGMSESAIHEESFERIGNIYEHPELLEAKP